VWAFDATTNANIAVAICTGVLAITTAVLAVATWRVVGKTQDEVTATMRAVAAAQEQAAASTQQAEAAARQAEVSARQADIAIEAQQAAVRPLLAPGVARAEGNYSWSLRTATRSGSGTITTRSFSRRANSPYTRVSSSATSAPVWR
jgi:hypothetical protein